MEHGRYIVVEGAIGAGKAALAEKIAVSFGARAVVDRSEEEFRLYDQMFALLLDRVPPPDLVVYLSARTDVLWRRLVGSGQEGEWFSRDYLRELNEAYNHFFFHYDRAPLLVVNTSEVDFLADEENFEQLLKEIRSHQKGVKQYIPLGPNGADTRKPG